MCGCKPGYISMLVVVGDRGEGRGGCLPCRAYGVVRLNHLPLQELVKRLSVACHMIALFGLDII